MRLTSRLTWFVAIAVLGYAASPADAQTAPAPPPPSGGTGGAGFDTQVGFQQRVNISPEDQVATFNAHLAYAAQARDTVQKQLQAARQQRDVVKILCLNDKLNQIDVAHRTLGERQKAHQAAVQRHDTELANHEFTIGGVIRKHVEQKMTEANQCIGQEAAYTGTTTTFTTTDPNLPPWDQSEPPPPAGFGSIPMPPIEVGPPTPASPQK